MGTFLNRCFPEAQGSGEVQHCQQVKKKFHLTPKLLMSFAIYTQDNSSCQCIMVLTPISKPALTHLLMMLLVKFDDETKVLGKKSLLSHLGSAVSQGV